MINRAAVLTRPSEIVLEERPVPEPGVRDVLVEVSAVGVCGSDVHYYEHGRIGSHVVRAPLVLGHLERGTVEADAGVVDEHVDGPELIRDPLEHRRHARRVGHVERHGQRAELVRGGGRAPGVAGGDRDARARFPQRAGERIAEAAVAAGDDGHPAVEPERVERAHESASRTISWASARIRSSRCSPSSASA